MLIFLILFQLAENAELGKLGDAGQEHKAQIRVARLQRTVEIMHHITQDRRFSSSCTTSSNGASYSSIRTTTCRPVCSQARFIRSANWTLTPHHCFRQAIFLIIFPQPPDQILIQFLLVQMLGQAHVKVQHQVFRPLGFQLFSMASPLKRSFFPAK